MTDARERMYWDYVDTRVNDVFDKVLKIIDKHIGAVERSEGKDSEIARGQIGIATCIRHEVERLQEALKGEQE